MRVILVRHASADDQHHWSGSDQDRPLDPTGERQAKELAQLLVRHSGTRLVSSPARRCVQTLQPLADELGQPIETTADLALSAPSSTVLGLVTDESFDNAVVCTHGEVMAPLLSDLLRRGVVLAEHIERRRILAKGTAWELILSADSGTFLLRHLDPTTAYEPRRTVA